tara:strand:- start:28 stop:528 length:501 start_codon:yes stop_codon:yes gene_type:complete
MSKKRKRRLKKLAKVLGAGLAIAGLGRAFSNRNARASTDADTVKAMTSDAAYTIPGGDETSFKVQDVKVNAPSPVKTNVVTTGDVLGRMKGSGPESGVIGQNKRAAYAQKMREAVTDVDGPPSILNPYRTPRVHKGRGNFFSKGGRVKGAGKAKRGFGKAFKGGKK